MHRSCPPGKRTTGTVWLAAWSTATLLFTGPLQGQDLTRFSLVTTPDPAPADSTVVVTAEVPEYKLPDDQRPKLSHIMKEVSGTQITVTKKTTVTKLDQVPTIIDNDQQEAFARTPGILVTEQQTPSQFNLSYRGLGNPQESEYVLVLQDGLPITTDWIGFPTLYYLPLYQSISEIQVIRGGNSLLYGPEPAPAINFVSRRPAADQPLSGYTEQVGGGYGLYSTYNMLAGSRGPFDFRLDFGDVTSNGQRDNAGSNLLQTDLFVDYRPDNKSVLSLNLSAYRVTAGDPGRITYQQFEKDDCLFPHTVQPRLGGALSGHARVHAGLRGRLAVGSQSLGQLPGPGHPHGEPAERGRRRAGHHHGPGGGILQRRRRPPGAQELGPGQCADLRRGRLPRATPPSGSGRTRTSTRTATTTRARRSSTSRATPTTRPCSRKTSSACPTSSTSCPRCGSTTSPSTSGKPSGLRSSPGRS